MTTRSKSPLPQQTAWDVLFIVPNICASQDRWLNPPRAGTGDLLEEGVTLGNEWIAIAPQHDPRVQAAASNPIVKQLLDGFRDERGKQLRPAVLIAAKNAPLQDKRETIVAFRNAVALSIVLRNRAAWIAYGNHGDPNWSDYCDLHPTVPGVHGLVSLSPALTSLHSPTTPFVAEPSPYVSHSVTQLRKDSFLYRRLGTEWRRTYRTPPKVGQYRRALFRSLELAYLAAATPTKNGASVHEWGTQMALWVSAMEVLAWADHRRSSASAVLDLLGEVTWSDHEGVGARRYTWRWYRHRVVQRRRVNAVQKAYTLLYKARNDFMHGNHIRSTSLRPFGASTDVPSLPAIAPIIYRTALKAYLQRTSSRAASQAESFIEMYEDGEYAAALRVALKISESS